MKLRDILPQHAVEVIEVRTNCPSDHDPDDTLFGYCAWDGEKLISLDGDSYFLDEEVYQYEWHDDGTLTYWINRAWISNAPMTEREFIEWVIDEIFDDDLWKINYGSFPEIACRHLVKMGYLEVDGDVYKRIEGGEADDG